jgi:hypothetical protein
MKFATRMFALALTMLPLLAAAQMTSNERIVAKVPFEFVLGNKVVPAGDWTVQSGNMNSSVLQIRNWDAHVNMFAPASPAASKKISSGGYTLVFHKYGNSYFLAEVTIAGMRDGYRLPETKGETELRAQNVPASNEILLASRQ